jgi:uncharacterized protein (DUF4415 family)
MPTSKGAEFTEADWDTVSDNPEWTDADFKKAKPFSEVFPELAEGLRRSRGRPKAEAPKKQVTLRLDADVVESFRLTGPGWQSRINDSLRKSIGLKKA